MFINVQSARRLSLIHEFSHNLANQRVLWPILPKIYTVFTRV